MRSVVETLLVLLLSAVITISAAAAEIEGVKLADKVQLGGAIALGHPLGATGAVRVATLMHGLRRHGKKYGMVTMCIGTGMGAAGVFEAL